jgi:hypothetical protein
MLRLWSPKAVAELHRLLKTPRARWHRRDPRLASVGLATPPRRIAVAEANETIGNR